LGKTVFKKVGDSWMVAHVGYTPDKSQEEKDKAEPKPEEFILADSDAIKAVFTGTESMQTGTLVTCNDETAIQLYVGVIGAQYRMLDAEGNAVARFIVGNHASDFSGTFVQVLTGRKQEKDPERDEWCVYKVPGYLEPTFKKKGVIDWWDRHLYNMESDQIAKITVHDNGRQVVVENQNGTWAVTQPAGWSVDPAKLSDWVDFVTGLKVFSWPEEYESYELRQNPPDFSRPNIRLTVEPKGGSNPPTLAVLVGEEYARLGGSIARIGEGMMFRLKETDIKKLQLQPADVAPTAEAPPATNVPPAEGAEAPAAPAEGESVPPATGE
ncbi:MAG TPA: DUF4340 domain-containing protein, partial [bacterium]|nr:DUF4340 domain-containing protein [bacterium]